MSMIIPNVEELVAPNHRYHVILKVFDWSELTKPLRGLYSQVGRRGYAVEQGFKCLFLQFLEDKSDREMEVYLQDSLAAKYFCSFGLCEATPDHCYFGKFRTRIGVSELASIFQRMVSSLKQEGLIREFYTFVDASKIEACVDSWRARDRAIADAENEQHDDDGNPTMNNKNVQDYSSDTQARYGVKGKNDIWLGYKRHLAVDMHQGIISKVAVTAANVHDGKAFTHVRPSQGAVVADKIYSDGAAQREIKRRGLHSMVIKKNNARDKNREKDSFLSSLRMPYEGVFSQMSKRARYRGRLKVYFQVLMEALVHNIKRLAIVRATEPIPLI